MEPDAPAVRSPDALAALIAVSITPVAGIVFLGWLPAAVLVSYFVDTFVGFGVVVLMVMIHVTGDDRDRPIAGWKSWTKAVIGLAILGAIMALPLSFPLWFLFADDRATQALLQDRNFLLALAMQVLMSRTPPFACTGRSRQRTTTRDPRGARDLPRGALARVVRRHGHRARRRPRPALRRLRARRRLRRRVHLLRAFSGARRPLAPRQGREAIVFEGDLASRIASKRRKR
jgi:hypothetical protein